MLQRPLGRSGLQVSPLCFGGNVFGWTVDEGMSFSLLDAWLDAGFNFVDTADVYSKWAPGHKGGESETIIGKWLKHSGKRDRVVIATKVGMDMGDGKVGLAPAYIKQAVEASLKRLQVEQIDLYQSHKDDETVPLSETLGAYADLIKEGKVRAIGASNYSAPRLKAALETSAKHGLPRYETLQPHYNLMEREGYESEYAPIAARENLAVFPYFGLARGFLTGKYRGREGDGAGSTRAASASCTPTGSGRARTWPASASPRSATSTACTCRTRTPGKPTARRSSGARSRSIAPTGRPTRSG